MPCDPTLRRELESLYADLAREIAEAGPACQLTGRCCRFAEYDHTLFISNLEADLLLEDGPGFQGPVDEGSCPFQLGKLCGARERRPLGCRIFYCDPSYRDRGIHLSETYIRRLKDLAVQLGRPWRYAPLHHFLREALANSASLD